MYGSASSSANGTETSGLTVLQLPFKLQHGTRMHGQSLTKAILAKRTATVEFTLGM